jgi:hypothetical protein
MPGETINPYEELSPEKIAEDVEGELSMEAWLAKAGISGGLDAAWEDIDNKEAQLYQELKPKTLPAGLSERTLFE